MDITLILLLKLLNIERLHLICNRLIRWGNRTILPTLLIPSLAALPISDGNEFKGHTPVPRDKYSQFS